MLPESPFHRHDKACRVPLESLFGPVPNKQKFNNYSYYYSASEDGTKYVRINGLYALEGCSHMSIPIFLAGKPDSLEGEP